MKNLVRIKDTEEHIIWKNISFKEHMTLNTHWEFEGIIIDERRFLILCEKHPVDVFLLDINTNEKHLIPSGSQAKAKNLALLILNKESLKKD